MNPIISGREGFVMTPKGIFWYTGEGPPRYVFYGDIVVGTGIEPVFSTKKVKEV